MSHDSNHDNNGQTNPGEVNRSKKHSLTSEQLVTAHQAGFAKGMVNLFADRVAKSYVLTEWEILLQKQFTGILKNLLALMDDAEYKAYVALYPEEENSQEKGNLRRSA